MVPTLLLLGVCALSDAGAEAGRVLFAAEGLTLALPQGRIQTLARGAAFSPGQVLRSGDSPAQLRLVDGAMVSLAPFSEFRVDELRTDGDGDVAYLSLLRGALRFRSGPASARFADRYRLRTWAADLRIERGVFGVRLCRDDCQRVGLPGLAPGIHLFVERGRVLLFNATGRWSVGPGEVARATDYRSPAQVLRGTSE
jgi:hypothetical protein